MSVGRKRALIADILAFHKATDEIAAPQGPDLIVGDVKDAFQLADPVGVQRCRSLEWRPTIADEIGQAGFDDRLDAVIVVDAAVGENDLRAVSGQIGWIDVRSIGPILEAARKRLQDEWREHR